MTSEASHRNSHASRERQITSKLKLILRGDSQRLASPLYAINWFDTRPAWIYHLYNFLAMGRLKRAGGKAFFKGRVVRRLSGDESMARKHLLIVNYPSADHFLNLVSDKLFMLIGLLRMLSVRRFSFVMHERIDASEATRERDSPYCVVLHFASSAPETVTQSATSAAVASAVNIVFAGRQAVRVYSESAGAENGLDYVTPHTIVIAAASEEELQSFLQTTEMLQAIENTDQHYAGLLKRSV